MTETPRRTVLRGAQPIGRLAGIVAEPAFRRHGLGHGEIAAAWSEIAGPELAAVSRPERLVWPRGSGESGSARSGGATLTVAVEGPRAIELQHAAPHIMASVNTLLGYRAVTRLRIVQAVPGSTRGAARRAPLRARADASIAGIRSPSLGAALARLGEAASRD